MPQKRSAVRLNLKAQDLEAHLNVQREGSEDDSLLRVQMQASPEQTTERRFVLVPGAALELQEDGVYRRHTLLGGQPRDGQWSFHHFGRIRQVGLVGGLAGHGESSHAEGSVNAPMNGQVVKVQKGVGDTVESGEVILILEAMKMENEVTAPRHGVLTELTVAAGDTVTPGQRLFCVEAAVETC